MTPQRTEVSERIDKLAERVDRAVARVLELNEPARTQAMELKSAIEEFHKDGLTLVVRHLKSDPRGKELLMELAAEPSVYTLFAMHGIIRTEAAPAAAPSQEDHSQPTSSTGFVPLRRRHDGSWLEEWPFAGGAHRRQALPPRSG